MRKIDADLGDLLTFAVKFSSLGSMVQEQIEDLLDGDTSINPNAVKLIKRTLGGANEDLDQAISDYELFTNDE